MRNPLAAAESERLVGLGTERKRLTTVGTYQLARISMERHNKTHRQRHKYDGERQRHRHGTACNAPSPPATRSAAATAPMPTPHCTRSNTGGLATPPACIMVTTKAPLSALVTKKIATSQVAVAAMAVGGIAAIC